MQTSPEAVVPMFLFIYLSFSAVTYAVMSLHGDWKDILNIHDFSSI